MKAIICAIMIFISGLCAPMLAQQTDLEFTRKVTRVDIPFEYRNGFIIVNVVLNDLLPLKFILDTGAEHTIITERNITDMLRIDYERRLTIMGADLSTELYAYLARGIKLQMGSVIGLNRSILVLEEDYIHFENFTGVKVHGILGSDFFRRFILKIDYRKQILSLYDPQHFEPTDDYTVMEIEIDHNKPYMRASADFKGDTVNNLKLLIDTGASLPLLLETNTHPRLNLPDNVIPSQLGIGMGGQIKGFLGRVNQLSFSDFHFREAITSYQDLSAILDSADTKRNGIIGNDILSRFTIVIDYYRELLYLDPNRKYDNEFNYDRSGLQIIASGDNLNTFIVYNVVPGSPAEEAGLQQGDEIKSLNCLSTTFMTLGTLTSKLQKRVGKKIRLKIIRRGEKRKFEFRLREII